MSETERIERRRPGTKIDQSTRSQDGHRYHFGYAEHRVCVKYAEFPVPISPFASDKEKAGKKARRYTNDSDELSI